MAIDIKLSIKRIAEIQGMQIGICPNCGTSEFAAFSKNEFANDNSEIQKQYYVKRKAILESLINKASQGQKVGGDINAFQIELKEIDMQLQLFPTVENYIEDFAQLLNEIPLDSSDNEDMVIEKVEAKVQEKIVEQMRKGNYQPKEKRKYNAHKSSKHDK
jgi:hypothetical protein